MDVIAFERLGYRIPPYRLSCMSKSVSKIIQELTSPSPVMYSAEEARFILRQVEKYIDKGCDADGA